MLEIPEAQTLASQVNSVVKGKVIAAVEAAHSPHKFAWFQGDPAGYPRLLVGKSITAARSVGGMLEISADDVNIVLSDGANLAFHLPGEPLPKKHQLLIQFKDASSLTVSVQMYGGILAFSRGAGDNPYYLTAVAKPSPLSEDFDLAYFEGLLSPQEMAKLSAKAFLATEQRIPGLGNGTLQDILYIAHIHPKRKVDTFTQAEINALFKSIKTTLAEMVGAGGRDTEKDLFGRSGSYRTKCSKKTVGCACEICSGVIEKASYMGGSIYFCPGCQPL
ncbi:MAG: endonuclease VIII [Anaerolineae bacterium]|nr:endonuclease VIII [Anaerolineae bacterium]